MVLNFASMRLGRSNFRIAIWPEPGLSATDLVQAVDATRKRINEILKRKRLSNVRFGVDVLAELPIDPLSRKFQLVVDAPLTSRENVLATIPKLASQ